MTEFVGLTDFDREIVGRCKITVVASQGTKSIPLQFPPIVENDGKSAKWDSSDQGAYEPIKTYNGSESRALTVKLKYVVVGGQWTPRKIAQVGRDLRSYFYNTVYFNVKGYPIVKIVLYEVVPSSGSGEMTCRLESVRTSYSGGLIRQDSLTFPLVTEHTLALEACTRIGQLEGGTIGAFGPVGDIYAKLRSKALSIAPAPEWF